MNIKQKITSGLAIAGMMASVVAPASFAANTVTIKNNSAWSWNKAHVTTVAKKSVTQNNTTVVNTGVNAKAKTGYNSSSFNMGGTNTIMTGSASNVVGVSVTGGTNTNANDCGCESSSSNDVTISGNGPGSSNHVGILEWNSNSVTQNNTSVVNTWVSTSSSTGGNSSNFNSGGNSSITTGDAGNAVGVEVGGSTNTN